MKAPRKRYSQEVKQEVLRRLKQGDKSVMELSRELGLKPNLLYVWQQGAQPKQAISVAANTAETKDDKIARLEKELEAARVERDLLKKAAAYFAKELK
jgi:transposase